VPSAIFNDDLEHMYALVRKVATDLIQEYALLVDLTGAGKVCALALFRLAHEFDLPCIHVSELGAISWLHR
jgi:hypothetical protein